MKNMSESELFKIGGNDCYCWYYTRACKALDILSGLFFVRQFCVTWFCSVWMNLVLVMFVKWLQVKMSVKCSSSLNFSSMRKILKPG